MTVIVGFTTPGTSDYGIIILRDNFHPDYGIIMLRDNFPGKIVFLDRLTTCTNTWTGLPLLRSILELDLLLHVQLRAQLEIFRKFLTTSTHICRITPTLIHTAQNSLLNSIL